MDPDGLHRPSRICKATLLKSFRKVAKEMEIVDLASLPTYHEAKAHAEDYQNVKQQVYAQLSLQDFGKWSRKRVADIFAS
ncbi:UNVERIFIED_CONTAM: hypothetical protein K2H54_036379 [Gekko kuhli]